MAGVKIVTLSNLERYLSELLSNIPSGDAINIPSEDIGGNIWIDGGD